MAADDHGTGDKVETEIWTDTIFSLARVLAALRVLEYGFLSKVEVIRCGAASQPVSHPSIQ